MALIMIFPSSSVKSEYCLRAASSRKFQIGAKRRELIDRARPINFVAGHGATVGAARALARGIGIDHPGSHLDLEIGVDDLFASSQIFNAASVALNEIQKPRIDITVEY